MQIAITMNKLIFFYFSQTIFSSQKKKEEKKNSTIIGTQCSILMNDTFVVPYRKKKN